MSGLSKRERVDAALIGEAVDRVPVSTWRHFVPDELSPELLAQASLRHFHKFDWDWLKVNPRATYYAEAWGNRYDYSRYDGVLPRLIEGPLNTSADLEKICEVNPTSGVFSEQLDLLRRIKAGINGAHFVQTVFTPLSVLAFLAARPRTGGMEAAVQAQYDGVRQLIRENPQGVHYALKNIAATLARYSAAAVDAGASGLFFAIVKLARQEILTRDEYAEFGQPYDQQVLQAVQNAPFNLLHICGPQAYFELVNQYPVHAVNWAAIGQQNPGIAEAQHATSKALIGGVDELGALQSGSPEAVIAEAQAAIQATGGWHLLLSPGCGTSMDVPEANLLALRKAADLAVIRN
jgi:uroporphyrinogen decarboxylase